MIALVLLTACGDRASVDQATLDLGREVYLAESCDGCHGDDRLGSELAPSLQTVHLHWSADRLSDYLKNPDAVTASDLRLQDVSGRWQLAMPGVGDASPDEVRALALYLLHAPTD